MFQKFTSGVKLLPFKKTGERGGTRARRQKSTFKYGDPRGPGAATDKERKRRDSKTLLTHLSPGHKKGQKIVTFWMYIFYLPRKKASKTEFVPKGWKSNMFIDITYKFKTQELS